jgi:hypothetical protein
MEWQKYIWVVLTLIAVFLSVWMMSRKSRTMPWLSEGFSGVVAGAGSPDCLYTLQGASEILSVFEQAGVTGVEEGPKDYTELRLLLSKLACMKKDLMSPSGLVQATLRQPFANTHDREPVGETVARCLAKTIPARELDLGFELWKTRGSELLRRLCTASRLTEAQATQQEERYQRAWADVYNVAKGACLAGEPMIGGKPAGPRDPGAYMSDFVMRLDKYEGYY